VNRYIHELLQGASARDVVEAQEDRKCAQCDGPMPVGARRQQKFCEEVCRRKSSHQKRKVIGRKAEAAKRKIYLANLKEKDPTEWARREERRKELGANHKAADPEGYRSSNREKTAARWDRLRKKEPERYRAEQRTSRAAAKRREVTVRMVVCQSCGHTDEHLLKIGRKFGPAKSKCDMCGGRAKKYGWCVNKVHCKPPVVDVGTWEGVPSWGQPRYSWPECLCTPGNIKPDYLDPNNKYPPRIKFEDADIPAFNYQSIKNRQRKFFRRYAAGEGIEKGKEAVSQEKKKQGGKWVPGISGGSRKGSSSKNPRRSTQGPTPRRARKPKDV